VGLGFVVSFVVSVVVSVVVLVVEVARGEEVRRLALWMDGDGSFGRMIQSKQAVAVAMTNFVHCC
jgi:hypothetical protein